VQASETRNWEGVGEREGECPEQTAGFLFPHEAAKARRGICCRNPRFGALSWALGWGFNTKPRRLEGRHEGGLLQEPRICPHFSGSYPGTHKNTLRVPSSLRGFVLKPKTSSGWGQIVTCGIETILRPRPRPLLLGRKKRRQKFGHLRKQERWGNHVDPGYRHHGRVGFC
jgi:hypothetical protein